MLYTDKKICPHTSAINHKRVCHLFSIELLLCEFGCYDIHKNFVIVFPICVTDSVKSFITLVSQIKEIWQIVSFFIILDEMINYDVTRYIVSTSHGDTELISFLLGNLDLRASYFENGLADFGDTYIIF